MGNYFVRTVRAKDGARINREFGMAVFRGCFADIFFVLVEEPQSWSKELLLDICGLDLHKGEVGKIEFKAALFHTMQIMPPRLLTKSNFKMTDLLEEGVFMPDELAERRVRDKIDCLGENPAGDNSKCCFARCSQLHLTTTAWFGGATAAFYPGVLKRIGELLQCDYYVTFPGANEALIHPTDRVGLAEVYGGLHCWNEVDAFSGKVFRYCTVREELQEVEMYDWW